MIGKPEEINVVPDNLTSATPLVGSWTSPVRLYKLEDGSVVEEDGVLDRATLLVGAGGVLPMADATALGLPAKYAAPAEPSAANTRAVADPATGEVVASITEDGPDADAFGRPTGKAQAAPPRTKAQGAPDGTK